MGRCGKAFVMVVSLGVMAVATALIPVVPGFVLIFACVAVSGFMTMALFLAIFGSVSDIVDRPEQDRSATGLVNLANLLGTLLGPWLFGVLLDAYGTGEGAHDYFWDCLFLALFPVLGIGAALVYAFTRKKPAFI